MYSSTPHMMDLNRCKLVKLALNVVIIKYKFQANATHAHLAHIQMSVDNSVFEKSQQSKQFSRKIQILYNFLKLDQ